MIRSELIKRSPIRLLEKTTHGGLQKGALGVIAGATGTGKTACLVHLATDKLFQEKHVIHVSFSEGTRHIIAWYEDIFKEVARRHNLDCATDVHDHIIKNRVIMNFKQSDLHMQKVEQSIKTLVEKGNFDADIVVVDGYNFSLANSDEFCEVKRFAAELNLAFWFSAHTPDSTDELNEIPEIIKPFEYDFEIIIRLDPHDEEMKLDLLKDHGEPVAQDTHLILDPHILLISKEN
ncbi:MAG: AAA family ATPase [Chitinivibrionales bacterium]|nr:AAA family ATPase [Chitinivibrionales bacterium]